MFFGNTQKSSPKNYVIFVGGALSGSYSSEWDVPEDATSLAILCVGGGGGGGGGAGLATGSNAGGGGGGGSGAVSFGIFDARNIPRNFHIVCGTGGAGGAGGANANGSSGVAGGASSVRLSGTSATLFNVLVSANAGTGGGLGNTATGGVGSGGGSSAFTFNRYGFYLASAGVNGAVSASRSSFTSFLCGGCSGGAYTTAPSVSSGGTITDDVFGSSVNGGAGGGTNKGDSGYIIWPNEQYPLYGYGGAGGGAVNTTPTTGGAGGTGAPGCGGGGGGGAGGGASMVGGAGGNGGPGFVIISWR